MIRRAFLTGAAALPVAGCATLATIATNAQTPAGSAALWGVARGMGEAVLGAAEMLDPGLAPVVSGIEAIIAAGAPLVASAATSATAAAQLRDQANALTLAAAPLISVIANVKKA